VKRVLKWTVGVDDKVHLIGGGQIVHVETQWQHAYHEVQVWTLEDGRGDVGRHVQAFGTGHLLPDTIGAHLGSAVTAGGALVWHLFEIPNPQNGVNATP